MKKVQQYTTPEEHRMERQQKLVQLQTDLVIRTLEASSKSLEQLEAVSSGTLELEDVKVTKDGDVIRFERKPTHRDVVMASSKIVDLAHPLKTQKHIHAMVPGFGLYDLTQNEMIKYIIKESAIEVTAEVVDEE